MSLLIALTLLVVLGGALLAAVLSTTQQEIARERATAEALARAKQALLAYAVAFSETQPASGTGLRYVPGYLPCPDETTAGTEGSTQCVSTTLGLSHIGRLPWRELGVEPIKDASSECLWYAVSGTFVFGSASRLMNWDNVGLFDVVHESASNYLAGPLPDRRAVAVIFAPGPPLAGQARTPASSAAQCGGNYTASAYLESLAGVNNAAVPVSASTSTRFISAAPRDTFNDRLVFITAEELFDALARSTLFQKRIRELTHRVAQCIAGFGEKNNADALDKRLPWAGAVAVSSVSVNSFRTSAAYRDVNNVAAGRLPYDARRSCVAIRGSLQCSDPERLIAATPYCDAWDDNIDGEWYNQWKDQFFYAAAPNFRPSAAAPTADCPSCLSVNGDGAYAAVLMFSGRKLSTTQQRTAVTEKGRIENYLEGRNASNHTSGALDYEASSASDTFNDVLLCIDADLNVVDPCPPS